MTTSATIYVVGQSEAAKSLAARLRVLADDSGEAVEVECLSRRRFRGTSYSELSKGIVVGHLRDDDAHACFDDLTDHGIDKKWYCNPELPSGCQPGKGVSLSWVVREAAVMAFIRRESAEWRPPCYYLGA